MINYQRATLPNTCMAYVRRIEKMGILIVDLKKKDSHGKKLFFLLEV